MTNYPKWYYIGNKRTLIPWLSEKLSLFCFDSVLDLYGGSGLMSWFLSRRANQVHYNDLLHSNVAFVKALCYSTETPTIPSWDELRILSTSRLHTSFEDHFQAYFSEVECRVLDQILSKIVGEENEYTQKDLILFCLSQAMIEKQSKGSFHESTMQRRSSDPYPYSSWNRPLEYYYELARQEVTQFLQHRTRHAKFSFSNLSDQDFFSTFNPDSFDLIYADPPYIPISSSKYGNYIYAYHVIEALYTYPDLQDRNLQSTLKKPLPNSPKVIANKSWTQPEFVMKSFNQLFNYAQERTLVLSYRDGGIVSPSDISEQASSFFTNIDIHSTPHPYENEKEATYTDFLFILNNQPS